jgi:hypothetical protein
MATRSAARVQPRACSRALVFARACSRALVFARACSRALVFARAFRDARSRTGRTIAPTAVRLRAGAALPGACAHRTAGPRRSA